MGLTLIDKTTWQLEAANNNANLYRHMFEAHGIPYECSKELFHTTVPPVPFYSSIITHLPATKPELINNLTRTATFDLYVKDSFADKLFDACWFHLTETVIEDTSGWEQVKTAQ
ncbi:hypothetical protein [Pseudovibrio sp. POLY-S9]|uniref:hypothetical protein n=1 Tax=Pseudovibrio sp. POLY-S9 TaxID=1576596 RepID=UPI000A97091E|nr:hypothetical protein [Pseudovibrio sp. POLY-S9]